MLSPFKTYEQNDYMMEGECRKYDGEGSILVCGRYEEHKYM